MWGSDVGLVLLLPLLRPLLPAQGYTLDLDHSLEFSGPRGSMFGYSVLLHTHQRQSWLVVGAPLSNSSFSPTVHSPGAIFRCGINSERQSCQLMNADTQGGCGKTCEAEADHQWLGVSLSRQPGAHGRHILACAHRWKNVFYSKKDSQNNKLPSGVCYRFGNELRQAQPIIPCYRDYQRVFGEDYGSCQAGISNVLTEDLMVMGAPGTSYWTGSVLVFNTSSRVMSAYVDDDSGAVAFGSYLGYSVGVGHFLHPHSLEVVGGAPQHSQTGKVFVFTIDNNLLRIVADVPGKQLGSYFGSSVCVVDLNSDGLSDLLVGAPMATGAIREEGRVHVYINQGGAQLVEAESPLMGRNSYAARFGESIADFGDMDDDGYHDVVVGAPQEDELQGAVYIYNGRKEGINPEPSQRITGSSLGRNLRMFGQSLSTGVDFDENGYHDVAVGAFLSDAAVVLRTRPVVQVKASLLVPKQIDQQVALCADYGGPLVCFNISVCFSVTSRRYRGALELHYNLTSDLQHKPSFPHRLYFHGNGTSNNTKRRLRLRQGQRTCKTHLTYVKRDVRDVFTAVHFRLSFALRDSETNRTFGGFPALKPVLQNSATHRNTISNQTHFARSCLLPNCSTDLQLSGQLVLPGEQEFLVVGSGRSLVLEAGLVNRGDDAFLPRLRLRFPPDIHFNKVLHNEDGAVACDVSKEVNPAMVVVDCSISSVLLPSHSQLNISFLLDVGLNSTYGDITIHGSVSSENTEDEMFLGDNLMAVVLPLRYAVGLNVHGFVSPSSFAFGEEDMATVDCYSERFNYTYKVLNAGPSRSVDTVVEVSFPKLLSPYQYRLLQLLDLQSSQGVCWVRDSSVQVSEDCDVPEASLIKQLVFFFSFTSTRRMFCGRDDQTCDQVVCQLGTLEAGREVSIQLEVRLNPAVLLQAPGRHGVMMLESSAVISSPKDGGHTILTRRPPTAQVVLEAMFTQKPSAPVRTVIIVVSLMVGLLILSALTCCLWKAGFFQRDLHKKQELQRLSWDFVPQSHQTESLS